MTTHFFHSGMTGAPTNTNAAGSTLNIIDACLNTGFNVSPVQSASVTDNVMTLTYASAHGYESLIWLRLDGAAGGSIVRRCTVTGANTLNIPVTGFANGAVAGTLETRVAPADWERVFSGTNVGVFRSKVIGPGSSRFFYRISDNVASGTPALLRGFEAMTDADTGTGPFPTVTSSAQGLVQIRASSATAVPWALVADQRTCYLFLGRDTSTQLSMGFGDCRPYNTADAFAAHVFSASSNALRLGGQSSADQFVARRSSGLGSAQAVCFTVLFGSDSGNSSRTYPSVITGGMTFARPVLLVDGVFAASDPIRGERRGLMHCSAQPLPTNSTFWLVFESVQGVVGRVVVLRDASAVVAFPVDEDWA